MWPTLHTLQETVRATPTTHSSVPFNMFTVRLFCTTFLGSSRRLGVGVSARMRVKVRRGISHDERSLAVRLGVGRF